MTNNLANNRQVMIISMCLMILIFLLILITNHIVEFFELTYYIKRFDCKFCYLLINFYYQILLIIFYKNYFLNLKFKII